MGDESRPLGNGHWGPTGPGTHTEPTRYTVRRRRRLRVDVTFWNVWRTPRIERYANDQTTLYFGIGQVTWWTR